MLTAVILIAIVPALLILGLEREWMAQLRLEHDALERTNLHTLVDAIDVTADVALAFEALSS